MSSSPEHPFWAEVRQRAAGDPEDGAVATLVETLAASVPVPDAKARATDLLAHLLVGAPFLCRLLARDPPALAWLVDEQNWSLPRTSAQMAAHLHRHLGGTENESVWMRRARRFRAREMARIAGRDLMGLADVRQVTEELSLLADVCLAAAWAFARRALEERFGGLGGAGSSGGLAVIGLGKLGAIELNFSSDVDLLFVYAADGETTGGDRGTLTNKEWAFRVVRQITRLVDRHTEDGRLFRVDLRLRPDGEAGPLAFTPQWCGDYLEVKGRPWERIALLRARYCAGDADVAAAFDAAIQPFVYRPTIDTELVESLRQIKRQIANWLEAKQSPGIDIKLGRGGIRELEFFIQVLQTLHAGRNPKLRETRTLAAIERLLEAGLIDTALRDSLHDDYCLLRKLEHRLQMVEDRQTHVLPRDEPARAAIAARMGLDSTGALLDTVQAARERVHLLFQSIFATEETEAEAHLRDELATQLAAQVSDLSQDAARAVLAHWPAELLRRLPAAAVADGLRLYARVCDSEPVAVRIVELDDGRTHVRLAGEDRVGLAAVSTGILAAAGLDIEGGRLFTIPRLEYVAARAMQYLVIRPTSGALLEEAARLPLERQLRDAASRWLRGDTAELRAEINAAWVRAMQARPAASSSQLQPIDLEIDNNADPEASVVDLWAEDAPGFLYAFTQALAMRGINVHQTRIRSVGGRVLDRFHLTDRHGRKILTRAARNEIEVVAVLIKAFSHFLLRAADPDRALTQFDALLDRLGEEGVSKNLSALSTETLLAVLATVLGSGSHVFDDFLRLAPGHLLPVLEAISSGASTPLPYPADDGPPAERRRQLIAWRDAEIFRVECEHLVHGEQPFGLFGEQLTDLAENVVRRAWDLALDEVAEILGRPVHETDGEPVVWAIAALGKFGGRELGFASDLELMVVFDKEGVTTGARPTSAAEFFERAVQQLRRNIPARCDGIFALDLRLRPHGSRGPLASSLSAFAAYYAAGSAAAPYERQALIRLRAFCGDAALGAAMEATRDRFTYGPEPFRLAEVLALRCRQIKELTAPGEQQLKLGPGALVEIEYAVQYLQLEHGHAEPAVRHPNTLVALQRLEETEVISADDAEQLRRAYILFRAVIDAMRLERGNAGDLSLPEKHSRDAEVLARRLAYEPHELFTELETRMQFVAAWFRARFGELK